MVNVYFGTVKEHPTSKGEMFDLHSATVDSVDEKTSGAVFNIHLS